MAKLAAAIEAESDNCGDQIRVVVGVEPQDAPDESGDRFAELFRIIGDSAAVKSVGLVMQKTDKS